MLNKHTYKITRENKRKRKTKLNHCVLWKTNDYLELVIYIQQSRLSCRRPTNKEEPITHHSTEHSSNDNLSTYSLTHGQNFSQLKIRGNKS